MTPLITRSETTHDTRPILIGVILGVGGLVLLLLVGYRTYRRLRPSTVPLPPKQPLAFERKRQMAIAQTHLLASSSVQTPRSTPRAPPPVAHRRMNEAVPGSSTTDVSSATGPPPSPSILSSQAHLVRFPTESEESSEWGKGRVMSLGSSASTMQHQRQHRTRTASYTGSIRSQHSEHGTVRTRRRSAPHRTRISIVLPQPLADGIGKTTRGPTESAERGRVGASDELYPPERRPAAETRVGQVMDIVDDDRPPPPPPKH